MRKVVLTALATVALSASAILAQPEDSLSSGLVVEAAAIGTAVQEREPVGVDSLFAADVGEVVCWTRIAGAPDTTSVTFVWLRNGEEMARVDLPVKSPMWRTWSSKKIRPDWTGAWEVRVLDPAGEVLKSLSFTITADTSTPAAPPDTSGTGQ